MSNQQQISRSVTMVKAEDVQRDENGRLQLDPSRFNRRMCRGFTRAVQTTPLFHLITNYLALDIEFQLVFCKKTGRHIQRVGRLSICNYFGIIIYDVFAYYPRMEGFIKKLPPARLKLGVYWDDINPNFGARPIAEVEEAVRQIIQGRVVVGHAIHNDIKVLSPWVFEGIDTRDTQLHACYRPYAKKPGGPPGLKTLAPAILGYSIQGEEHSSGEDAQATMGLFYNCESCIEREQGNGTVDYYYDAQEAEYVEEAYGQIDEFFTPPETEPKEWIRPPLTASGNFWKAGQAMLTGKFATSEIGESSEMSKSRSATSLSSLVSQSTMSTTSSATTTEPSTSISSSTSSTPSATAEAISSITSSTTSTSTTSQSAATTKITRPELSKTEQAGAFWAAFRKI